MSNAIQIESNVRLEKLLTTDPTMERGLRNAIAYVMGKARQSVVDAASTAMTTDPNHAAKAIRRTIYQQILGANLNILRKRRAGKTASVPASLRGRTSDTERILGYQGSDRGFILRFVNAGTRERTATHMDGHAIRLTQRSGNRVYQGGSRIGYRGSIQGKNFFGPAALAAINEVVPILQAKFEEIIQQQAQ